MGAYLERTVSLILTHSHPRALHFKLQTWPVAIAQVSVISSVPAHKSAGLVLPLGY